MTREELFEKYEIPQSISPWDDLDSWYSVEIYRIMNKDCSSFYINRKNTLNWVLDFLEKYSNDIQWRKTLEENYKEAKTLYITAKRIVFYFEEYLLKKINQE